MRTFRTLTLTALVLGLGIIGSLKDCKKQLCTDPNPNNPLQTRLCSAPEQGA